MVRTLGRYEIVRPIARGGMAEVFLARRRGPGGVEKRLVIKCIRRERATDPRFSAMFVNEARLSMSFAHKNIASVFDFGRVGDELFLVMEHVDGGSLGAAMARAGAARTPPDAVVVAYIGLEACQALDYAHAARGPDGEARSVVHRDVSPGNVLLSFGGEVKLVDFGVASLAADLDQRGRVRGTPGYMSPEQARGEQVDGRSDLWSLGVCLWEALAGRRAFVAADADALIQVNKRGELPPFPEDGPGTARPIPAQLRAVIERATRVDPADRFADARAMQLALDEYLVDARAGAAAGRRIPPQHLLAAWLAPLFVEQAETPWSPEAPVSGPVATFLDDGEAAVAGQTIRSIAATVAESEPAVHGAEPGQPVDSSEPVSGAPPAAAASSAAGRSLRRGLTLGAVATAALAAVTVVLLDRGGEVAAPSSAAPPPVAELVAAAPPPVAELVAAAPPPMTAAIDAGAPPAALGTTGAAIADAAPPGLAKRAPRRPRPPRDAVAPGTDAIGKLEVNSSPWARVTVVGRPERCAETPCTMALPAGTYTLRFDNPIAGLGTTTSVTIEAGGIAKVVETLTRPR